MIGRFMPFSNQGHLDTNKNGAADNIEIEQPDLDLHLREVSTLPTLIALTGCQIGIECYITSGRIMKI